MKHCNHSDAHTGHHPVGIDMEIATALSTMPSADRLAIGVGLGVRLGVRLDVRLGVRLAPETSVRPSSGLGRRW